LVVAPFGVAQGYTPAFGRAVAASRRQFRRWAEAPLYPRSNGNGNGNRNSNSNSNGDSDSNGNDNDNDNDRSRSLRDDKQEKQEQRQRRAEIMLLTDSTLRTIVRGVL
jgi:hypothetical protein